MVFVDAARGLANKPATVAMPFFRALASLIPANPERLRISLFIHYWVGPLLWKMVRSMLDPVTKAKIKVIKGDDKDAPCPIGLCHDLTQDQIRGVRSGI